MREIGILSLAGLGGKLAQLPSFIINISISEHIASSAKWGSPREFSPFSAMCVTTLLAHGHLLLARARATRFARPCASGSGRHSCSIARSARADAPARTKCSLGGASARRAPPRSLLPPARPCTQNWPLEVPSDAMPPVLNLQPPPDNQKKRPDNSLSPHFCAGRPSSAIRPEQPDGQVGTMRGAGRVLFRR